MKPLETYGYDAVGPGWKCLLETLDDHMVAAIENAKANATRAAPENRREGNEEDAAVIILQVKEKFGGLRVYFTTRGMDRHFSDELFGAVRFAESMSLQICEQCGSMGDPENPVETRSNKGQVYGWTRTLCQKCREESETKNLQPQSQGN